MLITHNFILFYY